MKYLEEIRELYEAAFPPQERRPWPALMRLLGSEPRFGLRELVADDGSFAGFVTVWQMPEGFSYVEHLAVVPLLRGLGIGSGALASLGSGPVVLEVELPLTPEARRRIGFYQRHGFTVGKADYVQPPYASGLPSVPMYLLTRGAVDAETAAARLHSTVYNQPRPNSDND